MLPKTKYARSDDVRIAYQVSGDGPFDVVWAPHTGARIMAKAEPGSVFVSRTVKDLVSGSGINFQDHGVHQLKGIPGEWRLFSAHF